MLTIEQHTGLTDKFKHKSGGEGSTPINIIQEKCKNIPLYILENPTSKFLDPSAGTGTYLVILYWKLIEFHNHDHIVNNMLYAFDTDPICYRILTQKLGLIKVYPKDFLKYNFNDMEFDVVLGNPPYKRGLHLKFLNKSIELSKNVILFIHPSAWLLTKTHDKRVTAEEQESIVNISKYKTLITFKNGNKIFKGANFFYPLSLTYIQKLKPHTGEYIIQDDINNKILKFKSFKDINLHNDSKSYISLRNKLLPRIKENNLYLNEKIYRGRYSITISKIRGSQCKINFFKDDFYTLIPRKCGIKIDSIDDFKYTFNTQKEAYNFLNYLKTDFARFCLSLYKITGNIKSGSLHKAVPYLDFNYSWSDEKLFKEFKISTKEIKLIKSIIPKFY